MHFGTFRCRTMIAVVVVIRCGGHTLATSFPDRRRCPSQSTHGPIYVSKHIPKIAQLNPEDSVKIEGITYRIEFVTFTLGILVLAQGIATLVIADGVLIFSIEPPLPSRIAVITFVILRQTRVLESPLIFLPSPRMWQVFRLGAVGKGPE